MSLLKKTAFMAIAASLFVSMVFFGFGVSGASAAPSAACVPHFVRFGQTLSGIGAAYGVNWIYLAQVNGIVNPNYIQAGSVICVPSGGYGTGGYYGGYSGYGYGGYYPSYTGYGYGGYWPSYAGYGYGGYNQMYGYGGYGGYGYGGYGYGGYGYGGYGGYGYGGYPYSSMWGYSPYMYSSYYRPYYGGYGYGTGIGYGGFYCGINGTAADTNAPVVSLAGKSDATAAPLNGTGNGFRYDGGPVNPVPQPKADPAAANPLATGLPVSLKPKASPYTYKAYGEK